MDSARPRGEDLSTTKHSTKYLHLLQQGYYDIVAISPPCATFSRATWATRRGPRPVCSLAEPRGLAKLTTKERDRLYSATFLRILLLRWLGLPLTRRNSSSWSNPKTLELCRPVPIRDTGPLPWQWPQHGELVTLPWATIRLFACRTLSSKGCPCSTTRATTRDRCRNWLPPQRYRSVASKNCRVAGPAGLGYLRYNCYDCRSR